MAKRFIKFTTSSHPGGLATVLLATSSIIAVERTLDQGIIVIQGAAYTVSLSEAIRVANELASWRSENEEAN